MYENAEYFLIRTETDKPQPQPLSTRGKLCVPMF